MKAFSVWALMSLSLVSFSAQACPGAAIRLNDDTVLTGEGVFSGGQLQDLNQLIKDKLIGDELEVFDSQKKVTHHLVILGGSSDSMGIMSVSYLVKDVATGTEKTLFLKSNYMGDGARSRGLNDPMNTAKPDPKFSSLLRAGC